MTRIGRWWPVAAIAVAMLVPLAATALPFQPSLLVQAAVLLGVVLAFLASGIGSLAAALRGCSPTPRLGLLLYAGAAIAGAAIGVASGNPPRYIVSQAIAMLLLPGAALAGLRVSALTGRTLTDGLAAGALAAVAVHALALTGPLAWLTGPEQAGRLALRYDQSVVAAAVLACILLVARVATRPAWWPAVSLAASATLVAGSMSRGSWFAVLLGGAAAVALTDARRLRAIAGWASGAALVVVAATGVAAALGRAIPLPAVVDGASRGEPNRHAELVAEAAPTEGAASRPIGPLPLTTQHVEIIVDAHGPESTRAVLWVEALADGRGTPERKYVPLAGSGQVRRIGRVLALPRSASAVRFGLWVGPGQGRWELDVRRVVGHRSAIGALLRSLRWRLSEVLHAARAPSGDETLRYRIEETREVVGQWREAGMLARILGRGLGATFEFRNSAWGPGGRRASVPTASYIHNFYLFLAFKLGVFGLFALLGLLAIAAWTLVAAIRTRASSDRSWLLAGSAAAWVAFLLWSITSPEIYDFRAAPLLGLMVAACLRAADQLRAAATEDSSRQEQTH